MKKLLILTVPVLLAACATRQLPPEISYDAEDFDAATLTAEPPRPTCSISAAARTASSTA